MLAGYTGKCLAGCCCMLGLASRLVSIPLTVVLIVAYAHRGERFCKKPFSASPDNFYQRHRHSYFYSPSVIVFVFGPGVFSLDWVIGRIYRKKKSG